MFTKIMLQSRVSINNLTINFPNEFLGNVIYAGMLNGKKKNLVAFNTLT